MPKRNFEEFRDLPRPKNTNHTHSRKHERVNTLLDHSKPALFRALKIARGIERQKLGRRQKTAAAEKQLDHIRRLKLEVVELKALDLAKTAEKHLYRSLLKVKSIASSEELPEYVRAMSRQEGKEDSVERLNVQARLFKSEVVQKATDVALEGIRAALGIAKSQGPGKRRLRAKDYANGEQDAREGKQPVEKEIVTPNAQKEAERDEWKGIDSSQTQGSQSPHSESENNQDVSSIDGDDFKRFASRLAPSSDSSSPDHDSDSFLPDVHSSQISRRSQLSHRTPSLSPSPTPSALRPKSPPNDSYHSKPLSTTTHIKTTTFLPTLLTTGYYSGSDSDAPSISSYDDNNQSAQRRPQRKNRMGQQARRALWEKKYKDKANHLRNPGGKGPQKKGGSRVDERGSGWDARRGAVESGVAESRRGRSRARGRGGSVNRHDRKPAGASMDLTSDVKGRTLYANLPGQGNSKKTTNEGPLHPSWEAARRAKETKSVAKPTGKKVVF